VDRQRLTYLTYRTLGAAMQRVPEPIAAAVATLVGSVMAHGRGSTATMASRHIERVLADGSVVEPDPQVVKRWARRSFRAYSTYWLDGARLPRVPHDQIYRRMDVERGWENLQRGMAAGKGVVMALPHVGSWEWGGTFLALEGYPMTSVAERVEPPELFEWFVEQRRQMELTIVPLGAESSGTVLQTLRSGGLVGLVCDRDIAGNGIEVDFFGERTTFPAGPATLALRTGCTLITGSVYIRPGGGHSAVLSPPLDTTRTGSLRHDVSRLTQEIARHFETYVRRAPEQWHLFQPNWPSDLEALGEGRPTGASEADNSDRE
jgi:KDO2-lipid IV(A) lauroyltransferase